LAARARELGLTNAEVARRAGLSERRFGNYVSDYREPDLQTLVTLARVLLVSTDRLLGFEPDKAGGKRDQSLAEIEAILRQLPDSDLELIRVQLRGISEWRASYTISFAESVIFFPSGWGSYLRQRFLRPHPLPPKWFAHWPVVHQRNHRHVIRVPDRSRSCTSFRRSSARGSERVRWSNGLPTARLQISRAPPFTGRPSWNHAQRPCGQLGWRGWPGTPPGIATPSPRPLTCISRPSMRGGDGRLGLAPTRSRSWRRIRMQPESISVAVAIGQ
jgi:transcriptional regulator with XRE-family HTH domain